MANASDKRFFGSLETALSQSNVAAVENAVEEAMWWAVNALRDRDDSALRTLASECNAIGQRYKSSTEAWRAWCAGQLQMIAAVSRAALSQQLPRNVAATVRERKNFLPILLTVGERELDASTVSSSIGLSLSQTLRELESLEALKLVQTDKENRRRWIRLTPLGHQAITQLGDTQREELTQIVAEARPFDDANAFRVRLEEMAQRLDHLENTFAAKASNVSESRIGDNYYTGTVAQVPNESALEHAREVLESEEAPDTQLARAMERALVEKA